MYNSPYPNFNLRHLAAAVAVYELGSLSRAAESVFLTQSAVTQGIAKLEQQLGYQLFVRSAHGAACTAVGQQFLARVAQAFHGLALTDGVLGGARAGQRPVRYKQFTWSHLKAFKSVVDCGSSLRAAAQLNLSQPTVHKSIRDFEVICGTDLFHRTAVGLEANFTARQIARHVGVFFRDLERSVESLGQDNSESRATLMVGSLPRARSDLIPNAVIRLLSEYQNTKVRIVDGPYNEQLDSLLHGRLDLIVGALRDPLPATNIEQVPIFTEDLSVVVKASHALVGRRDIDQQLLHDLSWVAPREPTPAREVFDRFFREAKLPPPSDIIECSSLVATRGLLLASDRAALLPARQVAFDVSSGVLTVLPVTLPGTERTIGYTKLQNWFPTVVQARFIELLEHEARYS